MWNEQPVHDREETAVLPREDEPLDAFVTGNRDDGLRLSQVLRERGIPDAPASVEAFVAHAWNGDEDADETEDEDDDEDELFPDDTDDLEEEEDDEEDEEEDDDLLGAVGE